jgi:hypothetical protein
MRCCARQAATRCACFASSGVLRFDLRSSYLLSCRLFRALHCFICFPLALRTGRFHQPQRFAFYGHRCGLAVALFASLRVMARRPAVAQESHASPGRYVRRDFLHCLPLPVPVGVTFHQITCERQTSGVWQLYPLSVWVALRPPSVSIRPCPRDRRRIAPPSLLQLLQLHPRGCDYWSSVPFVENAWTE